MSGGVSDGKMVQKLLACLAAEREVVEAAKLVHKRVTSRWRTQVCVLRLKDAVEKLEEAQKL